MAYVLALDIGGTNTRAALVDKDFKLVKTNIIPTVGKDNADFFSNIVKCVRGLGKGLSEVVAIAGGVPGRVRHDGHVYALPNVGKGIYEIPLAEMLRKEFGVPAYIINDAEVAVLAEANLGTYKDSKSLIFVTVSTGVGMAFAREGKIASSSYEAGHSIVYYRDEPYELEHLCSGRGIVRLSEKNGRKVKDARDFFKYVKKADAKAQEAYDDWLHLLSKWFRSLQEAFEPDCFVLTGGVTKSSDVFLEDLRRFACPARLELASCGQEAGLLGAAVYAWQKAEIE